MNGTQTCSLHVYIQTLFNCPITAPIVDYNICFFLSITGVLACLDGYMNIALEQTEEYVNGQLKNKYGDAFIRGNNVLYISTQKRRI